MPKSNIKSVAIIFLTKKYAILNDHTIINNSEKIKFYIKRIRKMSQMIKNNDFGDNRPSDLRLWRRLNKQKKVMLYEKFHRDVMKQITDKYNTIFIAKQQKHTKRFQKLLLYIMKEDVKVKIIYCDLPELLEKVKSKDVKDINQKDARMLVRLLSAKARKLKNR